MKHGKDIVIMMSQANMPKRQHSVQNSLKNPIDILSAVA